jgi:hypothetical protein
MTTYKKPDIKGYTNVLIKADIDFLKLQIDLNSLTLIANTGIQKLIDDCESYVVLDNETDFGYERLKPLLVLYSFTDSLKVLWMKGVSFGVQLSSMNSGDFEYGKLGVTGSNNFKDFELEIFTASQLNLYGVTATLPQHTAGNDIFYKNIELQCKHPDTLTRVKLDGYLRDFQSSLNTNQNFGVLCIGSDDFLGFTETDFPEDDKNFVTAYMATIQKHDVIFTEIFDDTLKYCPRVLGVIIVNTHFTFSPKFGPILNKRVNSVFCIRPNAKTKPTEEIYRQAYEVLTVFNSKPSIRTY